jgi:NADH:ubiquinone oxidoreductase subunit 5 (subunit L)/multisubunit Na+/H+ antiporter MnhA subunit
MTLTGFTHLCGYLVVLSPAVLLASLGLPALFGRKPTEQATIGLVKLAVSVGLLAAAALPVIMLATGSRHITIEQGDWLRLPDEGFHFTVKFVFDRLSAPFTVLTYVLCGTISAFANSYLHRERGYNRFFLCFAVFLLGMVLASVAGTIELLFTGWELVGLSSALLVAFFHERTGPVRNGLRVWSAYRIADAAFLVAALVMHHLSGAGDFDKLISAGDWPEGTASLTANQALLVGLLLLIAAAGKSALIPFSGWLPRAMEGPTPSSAVFYGALSVHLGAYLLLRAGPIIELSPLLCGIIVAWGLATAAYAAVTARVQTDIKSALAFASLTQVGIIVAEIGLGLHYIALVHMIGHACLRTLQLLRAPALLHDYDVLENALGGRLPRNDAAGSRVPASWRQALYRFGLHRGYFDGLLDDWIVRPWTIFFRGCDALEQRWTNLLAGKSSRDPGGRGAGGDAPDGPV